ncbi:MAG: hypothetical protein AAF488_00805 [Planctomycetota bacterium]
MNHLTRTVALALLTLLIHLSAAHFNSASAQVELVALNIRNGNTRVVATGEFQNLPQLVIPRAGRGEGIIIDKCGSVYEWTDQQELTPWPESMGVPQVLQGMVTPPPVRISSASPIAIFDDGMPHLATFRDIGTHSAFAFPTQDPPFSAEHRALPLPGWPQDKPLDFWFQRRGGAGVWQDWVLDRSGTLWWAKPNWGSSARTYEYSHLQVGPSNAWAHTVAATLQGVEQKSSFRAGKLEDVYLWTVGRSGVLYRARIGSFGRNKYIRPDAEVIPKRVGTQLYPNTVKFLDHRTVGSRREDAQWDGTYRVDSSGGVYQIDLETGEETKRAQISDLADARGFVSYPHHDEFDESYDFLYCRVLGSPSFAACPDRRALLAEQRARAESEAADAANAKASAAAQEAAHREAALASWLDLQRRYLAYQKPAEEHLQRHEAARKALEQSLDSLSSVKADLLAELARFERDHLQPTREAVAQHVAVFGSNSWEFQSQIHSTDLVSRLETSFRKVDQIRRAYANSLALAASIEQDPAQRLIDSMDTEAAQRKLSLAREWAAAAVEFAPGEEDAKELLAKLEFTLGSLEETVAAKIQAMPWPRRHDRFIGPGDVAALEAEAIAFVNLKLGTDFFDAYLASDWLRNQRNALGDVLDFQINFTMIRRDPADERQGIVANVKFITDSAQKSSPYRTAFVQVQGRVSLDKRPQDARPVVPASGLASNPPGSSGWGFMSWTFLLLLCGGVGYGAYRLRDPGARAQFMAEAQDRWSKLRKVYADRTTRPSQRRSS